MRVSSLDFQALNNIVSTKTLIGAAAVLIGSDILTKHSISKAIPINLTLVLTGTIAIKALLLVGQYLQRRDNPRWPVEGSVLDDIANEVRTFVFYVQYPKDDEQDNKASQPTAQGGLVKSNVISRLFQSFDPPTVSVQRRPQTDYAPERRTYDAPPPVAQYSFASPPAPVVRREETNSWWQPLAGASQAIFRAPIDQGPEKNEVNKRERREDEPREVDCIDPHQLKRSNTVDNQDNF